MIDDRELLRVLDDDWREAARRAGAWLVCRPGCTACCIGPFPITRLDAERLARGLAELDLTDSDRAQRVRVRARRAVQSVTEDDESCPALDPSTGFCDLYAWRPVSCRTYGPPVLFGEVREPPCALCFVGAPREEIERCRIEPDRDDLEAVLLDGDELETTVACALAHPEPVLP